MKLETPAQVRCELLRLRAEAVIHCAALRAKMWCQSYPAYDKHGHGRGSCNHCENFAAIRAADAIAPRRSA